MARNRNRQNRQSHPAPTVTCAWKFGDPQTQPNLIRLPVWLSFQKGKQPATGIVRLFGNGEQVVYPSATPSMDSTGTVFFSISLGLDAKECDIFVDVDGKHFTTSWQSPEPQLTLKESDGPWWKTLVVEYAQGTQLVPVTFEVWPTNGCQLAVREAGQTAWQTKPGKIAVP